MAEIKVSRIEAIAINVFTPIVLLWGGPTLRYGTPEEITRDTKARYLKYLKSMEFGPPLSKEEKPWLYYTPCGLVTMATAHARKQVKRLIPQKA